MNKKTLFLIITLTAMLILVTSVNATNDNTNTSTTHSISEKTTTTEPVVKEKIENTPTKEKTDKTQDKTITKTNKTQKNTKTTTRTIEVTNTEELVQVILDQVSDNENDEYVINLKQGTYTLDSPYNIGAYSNIKKVTYNGNNSIINCESATVNAFKKNHELILKDLVLNGGIDNEDGKLTVINCTINADWVVFWGSGAGVSIFNDDCTLNIGDEVWYQSDIIYTNDTVLINKLVAAGAELGVTINPEEISYNKIIENTTITTPQQNNINLTYVNCQINAKITNQGNLTLQNCSLSNNNMTTSGSKTDGFLLENKGNVTMIGCVVENNTFNLTNYQSGIKYDLYGAIVNNGTLNVVNTRFYNNSIGYCSNDIIRIGEGACIFNLATLNVVNSTFEDNQAGYGGGAISGITSAIDYSTSFPYPIIYWNSSLNIDNSVFNNNFASCIGGAIKIGVSTFSIKNSNFTNNRVDNQNDYSSSPGGQTSGSGAINIGGNGSITECEFKNNNVGTQDGKVFYNSFDAGAVSISGQYNMTHCEFINNTAERGAAIVTGGSGRIENCIFEDNYAEFTDNRLNSIILNSGLLNLTNNTLTNNYHANTIITTYIPTYQLEIPECIFTNNEFTNNSVTANTILIEDKNEIMNRTINNNQYHNTSIDDKIELNLPDYIFTGEPITITGTYTLNEPENYDSDIIEQTQFNIYIDGELNQTVNTLEFTITPTTTENMIITIQPTISQTRKSAIIRASTLNFTLEPITATVGETAQLKAHITFITDDTEMEINTGRVYFKVNGKILRDADTGRIIYADVTDNTATLDYLVPKTWNEDTEIEAVFTGNDDLPQKVSNTVNPTITAPETQETEFTVSDVTTKAGEEVTITVTTKNLDAGKVVLKVNGKTVKADDGKLYAKVTGDSVTFTYTVPKTLKAGDYMIKAVYTSGAIKQECEATLIIG